VQNEIFEMGQAALNPQRGAGVRKVAAVEPPLPDRAGAQPFVEPGEHVFGLRQGCRFHFLISIARNVINP
jgi:hypothetical protein